MTDVEKNSFNHPFRPASALLTRLLKKAIQQGRREWGD
jgi:hypothetical protein